MFAEDLNVAERILDETESGDAGINDCTIHPLVPEPPFGGGGQLEDGQVPREVGVRVRYPPHAQHTLERKIESKLPP